MIPDRQLTRDLRLSDWPCALERGTEADARVIAWTAANVWQPVITALGPVSFTSWRYWVSSGCRTARTGDHSDPGTVDVVGRHVRSGDLHRWMGEHLRDAGGGPLWGSLIDERDHVHYTRPGVGHSGAPEYLVEPREGSYVSVALPEWTAPDLRAAGLGPWLLGAAALYLLRETKS